MNVKTQRDPIEEEQEMDKSGAKRDETNSKENNGWEEDKTSNEEEEDEKIERVHQWIGWYILTVICTLFIGG